MISTYFNGVIEQVYGRTGSMFKNIVMVCYSNDFSVAGLESVKHYSRGENDICFAYHEFEFDKIVGAYEPFLDLICDMHRKYGTDTFAEFLSDCGVYDLHREILLSYYETGSCKRREGVLLDEVAYEQSRMTASIAQMLKKSAAYRPIVLVLNRFQLASRSTAALMRLLIEEPSDRLGIVLGVNEMLFKKDDTGEDRAAIVEGLEDCSQIYHIGNSGGRRNEGAARKRDSTYSYENVITELHNMIELLDYEQALSYFRRIERRVRFEDLKIQEQVKFRIYTMYAETAVLLEDIAKALEISEELREMKIAGEEQHHEFLYEYRVATCYMYQGKLSKALRHAALARKAADRMQDEELIFKADILMAQTQMSGWHNIFFCSQDIQISESLIERLMKYDYRNYLAHIYIYAYDNRPEVVAQAYRSEKSLVYFSKGMAIAREIGNENLINNAYQKNIMIASTNGMHEIAMIYSVRTFQAMKNRNTLDCARIYVGIGYHLSAMGRNDLAEKYYEQAISRFYHLHQPEDIAEVQYNLALNEIMQEDYARAEHHLQLTMKTIERLHLNSLRVCNLSKLYGLLALASILRGDRFNCERYLLNCSQFLNYILEKEKKDDHIGIIHDYAKCDDDMFLYSFSKGLLAEMDGDDKKAFELYEEAEKYLQNAEGNQFFIYRTFRKRRMELFQRMDWMELYSGEEDTLARHDELLNAYLETPEDLLKEIVFENDEDDKISEKALDMLSKQKGIEKDYYTNKRQMDFISRWQKLIDVNGTDIRRMVENAVRTFLNHFNNDCALYVRFQGEEPEVFYNNTGIMLSSEDIHDIVQAMWDTPQGFAVSKINGNYFEYSNIISYFGLDDVCSIAIAPFFRSGRIESLFITYITMKDNWHSSIDRYMLTDEDLALYQLLFREISYSINRMEAYEEVYEVNQKLSRAAVTDMLTGVYNRAGMYHEIEKIIENAQADVFQRKMGILFIDLDNFKHYNDTFGHDAGDLILVEMSKIFCEVTGSRGFVSRFGGDEFIIILYTNDRDELEGIAKEIYAKIHASNGFSEAIGAYLQKEIIVEKEHMISCSIGIASSPEFKDKEDINRLIQQADDLLYAVKGKQKGTYAFF